MIWVPFLSYSGRVELLLDRFSRARRFPVAQKRAPTRLAVAQKRAPTRSPVAEELMTWVPFLSYSGRVELLLDRVFPRTQVFGRAEARPYQACGRAEARPYRACGRAEARPYQVRGRAEARPYQVRRVVCRLLGCSPTVIHTMRANVRSGMAGLSSSAGDCITGGPSRTTDWHAQAPHRPASPDTAKHARNPQRFPCSMMKPTTMGVNPEAKAVPTIQMLVYAARPDSFT